MKDFDRDFDRDFHKYRPNFYNLGGGGGGGGGVHACTPRLLDPLGNSLHGEM